MKTCAFVTLGCKVNQYETQAIRETVLREGYVEIPASEPADLYIINTCTVTAMSDSSSMQCIRRATRRNPAARIVVTGCYAEANKEALDKMDDVDVVVGQDKKAHLSRIICSDNHSPVATGTDSGSIFDMKISRLEGHTRAFLKIEDGCDERCSYCAVPYVRGGVKSRSLNEISDEARRLASNGYREVVLTGVHLGAYGKDMCELPVPAVVQMGHLRLSRRISIIDVLHELEGVPDIKRIRLSSIESNEITNDLISLMADSEKICPHLHIPLQSGDDYMLKRMNRRYTSGEFISILDRVRDKISRPSFTTDVIVGFPGEETRHFENTIDVSRKAGFSRMHIFPYSARNGTPAASMDGRCAARVIAERKTLMESVAMELAREYKRNFIGKDLEVLVESGFDDGTGRLCGYTERYVKVIFGGDDRLINTLTTVRARDIIGNYISGAVKEDHVEVGV